MHRDHPEFAGPGEGHGPMTEDARHGTQSACESHAASFGKQIKTYRKLARIHFNADPKRARSLIEKAVMLAETEKSAIEEKLHAGTNEVDGQFRLERSLNTVDNLLKSLRTAIDLIDLKIKRDQKRPPLLDTTPQRYRSLDHYKRRILATVEDMRKSGSEVPSISELSHRTRIADSFLKSHWRKLIEEGFLIKNDQSVTINPNIAHLVESEKITHELECKMILPYDFLDIDADPVKSIFFSNHERIFYGHISRLFPNHLIYPNMTLRAIFVHRNMGKVLCPSDFEYYRRAMVDLCIISTDIYRPVLGIELDSGWHDFEDSQVRDEQKNRVFTTGGLPLLRVRIHGEPTTEEIRQQLCDFIDKEISNIRSADSTGLRAYSVVQLEEVLAQLRNQVLPTDEAVR